jgi:microcystin-dependent protein
MSDPFLGEIRMFGGTFAPQGWAACDGSLLSISQNDALYAIYGTTYGGDGVSTFGLPNLLGRVPIHDGQGAGLAPYVLGDLSGTENVSLQAPHHPAHTHAFSVSLDTAKQTAVQGNLLAVPTDISIYYEGAAARAFGADAIGLAPAGNQPHENRMPSLAITYIVALAGIFPSRP